MRSSHRLSSGRISTGCLILLALAGVFIMGLVVLVIVAIRDERPANVADLQVKRVELPEAENGFSDFLAAAAVLKWPEGDEGEALGKIYGGGEAEWDEELVSALLAQNEEALRYWEQSMLKGRLQPLEVKDYVQDLDYLAHWRSLGRLAMLKTMQEVRAGQTEAAWAHAFQLMEFGTRIQKSQGPIITFLVANAVRSLGLATIRDVGAQAPPEPDDMPQLIARLQQFEIDRQSLADSYRIEYLIFSNTIDSFISGNGSIPGLRQTSVPFFFKPNQTRRLFAEYIRWAIKDIERPLYQPREEPPEEIARLVSAPSKGTVRLFLSGNAVGKVFVGMTAPALERVNLEAVRQNWTVRATQVFVALKSYEAANGQLPENLDALVPDYLPEVPIDPFDGQPMKYAKEDRKIYTTDAEFSASKFGTIVVP